jgi:hypothetical protein
MHQRDDTTISEDGKTVFVRVRVTRRAYEFARHWAIFHAKADPSGTAEDQIEGYLNKALKDHMDEIGWTAPPEIEALYPDDEVKEFDPDKELPF